MITNKKQSEWVRPPHVPAQPLSDAEFGLWEQIDRQRRFYDRVNRGRAAKWRIDNPDGYYPPERISDSPTRGCYVPPSVHAFPRSDEQRRQAALEEIMDPKAELGLYTRGGGGWGGLYLNVLRTTLKRKLKREGQMEGGRWVGGDVGRKERRKVSAWVTSAAVMILILISSPPWPGTH